MKKTDDEQQVLDNKKEMDKEKQDSTREELLTKMKLKQFDLKVGETFNNMQNFRRIHTAFGKVKKKLIFFLDYTFK